ncbi:hypothetical protein [Actinocorallia populi]|uniref:hypothetical protein n=1 Tax=Actinocorallia populi TaxID=2079200 RepID=UPI000D08AC1D|nr:hypothetical protein [Actinocorallia populi]
MHEHFSLEAGEVLVETNDPRTRTLTIRPEKAATSSRAKPSQWRFLPGVPHTRAAEFDGSPYEVIPNGSTC